MAAMSAQEINYSTYARKLGLMRTTIQRWLSVLERTFQWYELPAYTNNAINRVAKKGKGYLSDTGIACYLQHITNPQQLLGHPLQGALFENYCVNQVRTLAARSSMHPTLYHWRNKNEAEVDIILAAGNKLYPIEVKSSMHPNKLDARWFQALKRAHPNGVITPGIILYPGTTAYPVADGVIAWPYNGLVKK